MFRTPIRCSPILTETLEFSFRHLEHRSYAQISRVDPSNLLCAHHRTSLRVTIGPHNRRLKNREIALRLRVKEHSVWNNIHRVFEKLGVPSRVEFILVMYSVNAALAVSP